jgi:hypothetical protein
LGFLGFARLAAETPVYERWIILDFLGFSRLNRAFSMGCAGSIGEAFLSTLLSVDEAQPGEARDLAGGKEDIFCIREDYRIF